MKNGGKREGAGRKPLIIDWGTVDRLLMIACTGEEIASYLGVNYDTLNSHCKKEKLCDFSEYIKNGINKTFKVSLRRAQRTMALGVQDSNGAWLEKPNVSMLIWLGKQTLGQTDKNNMEFTDNTPQIKLTQEEKDSFDKL